MNTIEIDLDPSSEGPEIIIQKSNGTTVLVDPKWAAAKLRRWIAVCFSAIVTSVGAYLSLR